LQKCPADEGIVPLATSNEIDTRKCAIQRESQRRNMNVRKMHIDFPDAADTANRLAIDDRKLQLRRKVTVDATCRGTRNDQRPQLRLSQRWNSIRILRIALGIKSDIYK